MGEAKLFLVNSAYTVVVDFVVVFFYDFGLPLYGHFSVLL